MLLSFFFPFYSNFQLSKCSFSFPPLTLFSLSFFNFPRKTRVDFLFIYGPFLLSYIYCVVDFGVNFFCYSPPPHIPPILTGFAPYSHHIIRPSLHIHNTNSYSSCFPFSFSHSIRRFYVVFFLTITCSLPIFSLAGWFLCF